jgi:hypothetical protein
MNRRSRSNAMLGLLGGLFSVLACGTAVGLELEVDVGFGGVYRAASWTPIRLVSRQQQDGPEVLRVGQQVRLAAEDPDGQFVWSPPLDVVAGPDGRATATGYLRFGRPSGRLRIETHDATATQIDEVSLPPPLASTERVILFVGDVPAAERASRMMIREDGSRPVTVRLKGLRDALSAAPAPPGLAFDGVDQMVLCGTALLSITGGEEIAAAIDAWVRRGGRLVLGAGSSAADIAAGGGVAAAWLPGQVDRLVPWRRTGGLETFARASRPLEKSARGSLLVPVITAAPVLDGVVLAFEGQTAADLPVVIRRAHGFGAITWVGCDLDAEPFRSWQGTDSLLVELLEGRQWATQSGRSGETHRDSLDLGGQLRRAIDRYPRVAAVPFELIAAIGLLYVAALYPLDWWLASRRPQWSGLAWISLPMLVVVASGLAWIMGRSWKGTDWHLSVAGVVDLDAPSGGIRGLTFAGIWAPENTTVDLQVAVDARPGGDPAWEAVSWFGATGRSLGGPEAIAYHPSLAAADYALSADGVAGVSFAAASSRTFQAEWWSSGRPEWVESSLTRTGQGTLRGRVTHRLPFPLVGAVLVHGGWLYDIGRLDSGEAFDPDAGRGPRSLASALTRQTAIKDRNVTVRWQVDDPDVDRILEIAGLHAAAGGSGYTSLDGGFLGRLDLTPLLAVDRAILIGRGPSAAVWRMTGPTAGETLPTQVPDVETTIWRIVIGLESTEVSRP